MKTPQSDLSKYLEYVSIERISTTLNALAMIGADTDDSSITRLAYSLEEDIAFNYIAEQAFHIGLKRYSDEYGNMYLMQASTLDRIPIVIGSHLDTVDHGGRFDGTVGVITGLEVCNALRKGGIMREIPICLGVFRAEEATRFERGDLGSRLGFGILSDEEAANIVDKDGVSLATEYGRLKNDSVPLIKPHYIRKASHFIEVHIEQGPILHREGYDIGVVEGIAAFERYLINIVGKPGHSGTLDYISRRDAVVAASEMICALDRQFRCYSTKNYPTVATIGKIVTPEGSINRVCGRIELYLDVRDICMERRSKFVKSFFQECRAIAKSRKTSISVETLQHDVPVVLPEDMQSKLCGICDKLNIKHRKIVSGAAHDALIAANAGVPTCMLFVPSIDGHSHNSAENTPVGPIGAACSIVAAMIHETASKTERESS